MKLLLVLAILLATQGALAAAVWETLPLPPAMPAPESSGLAKVNGIAIYWASFGAGDPVILLHGGAGNADHWALQVPALARRHRVIALDSRGHGRSTRDQARPSYHRMAEDVRAVMDALRLDKASIVGWSDGGIIGLDLAIHHPERVEKLVAFGANYDLAGMRADGPRELSKRYFEKCAADYRRLSPTPEQYPAFYQAMCKVWESEPTFSREQLSRIRAPTLIADGEHDELIRADHTRELARLIPRGRLLFIAGASHFALWQRPEAFNEAILGFLDEGAPRPAEP